MDSHLYPCVVGRGYLLWPVCFLDKSLLVFVLLHFVPQVHTCLLLQVYLDFLLLHSNPLRWKEHLFLFFLVLVLEVLVSLHRTVQLHLLWYQWLGHRLRLLWCWMVYLGNEPRSFCYFWDCIEVLHFGLYVDYVNYVNSMLTLVDYEIISLMA